MRHGRNNLDVRLSKEERRKNYKRLLIEMKPYYWQIIISIIFICISTVLAVIAPQWLSKLTDEITKNAGLRNIDLKKIMNIGIVLIVFYLSDAIFSYLSGFIMATITQKYVYGLRKKLAEKTNRIPLKYYDAHQYGDTLSIITNDVDTVGSSIQQSATMTVKSTLMLLGVLIAMFITCWQMALTVLIIVPLMLLTLVFITKIAVPQYRKSQAILGELNGKIEEDFTGHTVVKVFDAVERKSASFESSNKAMCKAMTRAQSMSGIMQPIMSLISYFAYAAVCVVGGILMNKGGIITFGTITAFIVYVDLFQSPMSELAQAVNSLQMATAASGRVYDFFNEEELSKEKTEKYYLVDENGNRKVQGRVEFKNVKFGYDEDRVIIPNFSATIEPGQKVAIVGPTGAGKTTLVNLLMRFYDYSDGDILIDGISIKDMNRREIHDIFGMVLQDTWMFEGTIRDNILFSNKDISEEALEEICKETGIWHYINTLPNGLDCYIENESGISGGQKQLITIARAMVEDAPLIILDEATSNVDTRTELLIQNSMDTLAKGRTCFVIAHRLSTIRNADLILVMKEGNIVEQGTHDTLIKQNGFYADLYNSQFIEEE